MMASNMIMQNYRRILSMSIECRNVIFIARQLNKIYRVGDNRGMCHKAQGLGEDGYLEEGGDKSMGSNSSVYEKLIDKDEPPIEHVPFHVYQMRKKMQRLHSIPDTCDTHRPPPTHNMSEYRATVIEHDDHETEQIETAMEPVDLDLIRDKFAFMNYDDDSREKETVVITSFGLIRFDTDPMHQQHLNAFEEIQDGQDKYVNGSDYVDDQHFALNSRQVDTTDNTENFTLTRDETFETKNTTDAVNELDHNMSISNSKRKQTNRPQINHQVTMSGAPNIARTNQKPMASLEKIEVPENIETENGNFFDEQYFENERGNQVGKAHGNNMTEELQLGKQKKSYVDSVPDTKMRKEKDVRQKKINIEVKSNIVEDQYFPRELAHEKVDVSKSSNPKVTDIHSDLRSAVTVSDDEEKNIHVQVQTKQEMRVSKANKPNLNEPKTLFDLAMKIRLENKKQSHISENADKKSSEARSAINEEMRTDQITSGTVTDPKKAKWKGKVDSKGFRILTDQVLQLYNLPRDVIVKILGDSVLYEDDKLLAIYKPYGLASHGGPGIHNSVGQLLEPLAKLVGVEKLMLLHRLDKETTGVMLLAKSLKSGNQLHDMFVKQQVIKKYWLITKGVPSPTQGVIDIPITEGTVGTRSRMTLRPKSLPDKELLNKSKSNGISRAITNFQVLDSNNGTALVQCQPEGGVKHQIRCHMAFALNTPILGDHKYSHYDKMAPQKLDGVTLERLGIRQAKVRHLAMHLHAKQIILPEYSDGKNLFISANLPQHFSQNMKWLKLKSPPVRH